MEMDVGGAQDRGGGVDTTHSGLQRVRPLSAMSFPSSQLRVPTTWICNVKWTARVKKKMRRVPFRESVQGARRWGRPWMFCVLLITKVPGETKFHCIYPPAHTTDAWDVQRSLWHLSRGWNVQILQWRIPSCFICVSNSNNSGPRMIWFSNILQIRLRQQHKLCKLQT